MATLTAGFGGVVEVSGVYPHLAYWNPHGECGTGAVVPWAGRLWFVSYGPHFPNGSEDKLYWITPELELGVFDGSVGGTHANRMIHKETEQLLIGPYVIDKEGNVRVIPLSRMAGRLTGTARHLFEPERSVYYATMEEGLYEVDLVSLEVRELFADNQGDAGGRRPDLGRLADLPGYHGKGLYSGQGVLVYSNNGENSPQARHRPDIPSGCLAEWDGLSEGWRVVRRAQFTEVSGPGGLYGNGDLENDPIWALGWDHLSVILMVRGGGGWTLYRLPKATHTYDGAHGWNTEWPRIRDVGLEEGLLMNMHGMFWSMPADFRAGSAVGLRPISTYLKVVGDFCSWDERLVFGCDVTARSEFLNTRKAKGEIAAPGESHSNLWFTDPGRIGGLGPVVGHGAVWLDEAVAAGQASDAFLFAGFRSRGLFLAHAEDRAVKFGLEVDRRGDGKWESAGGVLAEAGRLTWHSFPADMEGEWIRVVGGEACRGVVAQFHYSCGLDVDRGDAVMFRGVGV
ncbi:MAG: hypothetical protein ACO34E_01385, partial [Limisphaerales bacterium]